MRRIGFLSESAQATRFCDYLLTLSIEATTEEDASSGQSQWAIWIRDEEKIEQSRQELQAFSTEPGAAKYDVGQQAAKLRDARVAEHLRRKKQQQKLNQTMKTSSVGGMMGGMSTRQQKIPVSISIMVLSIVCTFATNFGDPTPSTEPGRLSMEQKVYRSLSFVERLDYRRSEGDAFASIKKGHPWRVITPMFLHGSMPHIVFNMLGLFILGGLLERLHGSLFLLVIVLVTHATGMAMQVLMPGAESLPEILHGLAGSPFVIGASGAVYGLFGYLWVRPMVDTSFPVRMSPTNVLMMLGWLVLCTFALDNNVANGAHLGGLIGGVLFAVIMAGMIKPSKPSRT